jgi:aspartate-semialdehyde dehydrogenase
MAMAKKNPDDGRVVAVVGATGAVGAVGNELEVEVARPEAFDGVDFAFFAATGSLSKDLAPEVASRGGVAIDKSSTWRMNDEVPLVVPEINPEALEKHRGIVSCPNCTTIGFVMALEPLSAARRCVRRSTPRPSPRTWFRCARPSATTDIRPRRSSCSSRPARSWASSRSTSA